MEERQITVDGQTYALPEPFIVLATQNPIEYEGTFPLPEAQLDRFLVRIHLGYPTQQQELQILDSQNLQHPLESLQQVISAEEVQQMQEQVKTVYVDPLIKEYIVALTTATRRHDDLYLGASPRGSLALYRTAQAAAAIRGRDYVTPDDVKALATPVLGHRIIINPAARIRNVQADTVIDDLLRAVPVPGSQPARRLQREVVTR
jgi:MoxR-like ATPase